MDFVDEQHVVRFEIGQQRGEVAGALQHRPGGLAQVDAHLARDDVRQRGLAQARRAEQQHMVERLAALFRRLNEYLQLPAYLLLPDVFVQQLRAQCALQHLLLGGSRGSGNQSRRGGKVVVVDHALESSFNA